MNSNKLRVIRKEIGMPLSELARRAKVSRTTITEIELHGRIPKGDIMLSISAALNKDPREIFFIQDAIQE
ncbi:helix-turn-helix transcriptional regulator [Paenibacillus validus]|uniref:helix-turn-helix transcriptional regulator n=1 Tax=Paenibacillus validus TaxID=44253 RepID=UPI001FD13984|nr:helix-turn-helix transcriptional regulator [Paenibacillus validus]MED4602552.1 helix-turn-helix transcriptional regulator [Paenibacillus validus]MED4606077.1 helix-turn-helix transcriptional regulator [Paenibacillus validus]